MPADGGSTSSGAAYHRSNDQAHTRHAKNGHIGGYTTAYLRGVIRGRESCLSSIPGEQEKAIALRTGTGTGFSYSRAAVARILHVSLVREGELEHEGVAGIRAAASRGCPARKASHHPAPKPQDGPSKRQGVVSAATAAQQGAISPPVHSGSSTILWVLIAAGMLAASAVAAPTARRRIRVRTSVGTITEFRARETAISPAPLPVEKPDRADDPGVANELGLSLQLAGDLDGALAAFRRADACGDPGAAVNLGVLLEQRGDLDGALAAYRRADERGDVNGSFNLGCLLAEAGDVASSMAAFRRADERGDPAAPSNIGVLQEEEGDLQGALAAYRRADERGDAIGALNLGLLLARLGDREGARRAYLRAAERGDPDVQERARSALAELEDEPIS